MAASTSSTNELSGSQTGSVDDPNASNAAAASLQSVNETLSPDTVPTQLDKLKQEKLRAEIDEIRFRIRDQSYGKWQSLAKATIKYLAIIVPVAVGLVGLIVQWNEFQDQRERLARFEVGPEVTKLAMQLNNSSDEGQRSLAAYQLAWFGRPAVFLLFERLVTEERPAVREAIIMALADIDRNNIGSTSVITILVESTTAFVGLALDSEQSAVSKIEQRLTTQAVVAAALRSDNDENATRKEYLKGLSTVQSLIESQPSQQMPNDDKNQLLAIVEHKLREVSR